MNWVLGRTVYRVPSTNMISAEPPSEVRT
jgi:hypothetical protein